MDEQTTSQECSAHGCDAPAEHPLIGAARLCLVHWLRARVRANVESLEHAA